jgi:hypothetical protein
MEIKELKFMMKKYADIKIDLLDQIRDLEQSNDDPECLAELEIKLDIACSLPLLVDQLEHDDRDALNFTFISASIFGPNYKPPKWHIDRAPAATEALLQMINSRTFDLMTYRRWRARLERAVEIYSEHAGTMPDIELWKLIDQDATPGYQPQWRDYETK